MRRPMLTVCVVIQFAKLSGFSPIITTASKQNEVFLKSIGATHVVDRSIPLSDLDAAVKAITVKPFKVAYDAVSSAETQNAVYDILAPSGKLEIVLGNAVDEGKITSNKEIKHISANVHLPQHRELGKSLYARLTGLLETGEIMVPFSLSSCVSAPMLMTLLAQQCRGRPWWTCEHS